ncbi:MAG: hypothetical protein ABSD44_02335 [Terracidiphilus sp.]
MATNYGLTCTSTSIASALALELQNAPGSMVTANSGGSVNILVSDSTAR